MGGKLQRLIELSAERDRGLFRQQLLGCSPVGTLANLFSDLRGVSRCEYLGEDSERKLQGARLQLDHTEGQGSWEFYRLGEDVYLVAADGIYDSTRSERVPGEGLVEIHLRLSGVLEMTLPGTSRPLVASGPCVLLLHQPSGVDTVERVLPNRRDTGISMYCRPSYLSGLVSRHAISSWQVLEGMSAARVQKQVWYRMIPLSPALALSARGLLHNPYRGGVRLLHAEAKVLEILCELLHTTNADDGKKQVRLTETEIRQLNSARRILASQLDSPPRLSDMARQIGMSESKLKRVFKARYGITMANFNLECRMRYALELLRDKRQFIGYVAHQVGYRHQTSFTCAFREYFGFLPSAARNEMH